MGRALTAGVRSFLEQPDWLKIPWATHPSAKSSLAHLLDIFCTLPGLYEDRKSIHISRLAFKASRPDLQPPLQTSQGFQEEFAHLKEHCKSDGLYSDPAYRSLVAALVARVTTARFPPDHEYHTLSSDLEGKVHAQFAALRRWRYTWLDEQAKSFTTLPTPIPNYPTHLFGSALNFPNLYQAKQYAHYNVILYTLSALLYELEHGILSPNLSLLSPRPHRQPQPYDPNDTSELLRQCRHAAIEICRSVPYHLSYERHGSGGAYLLMFPLLCASQPFAPPVREESTEEGRWIFGMLKKIETDWGMGSGSRWVVAERD